MVNSGLETRAKIMWKRRLNCETDPGSLRSYVARTHVLRRHQWKEDKMPQGKYHSRTLHVIHCNAKKYSGAVLED